MKRFPVAGLLCTVLAGASFLPSSMQAAIITVTNANDSGPGSLRDAVDEAVSGDEIRFDAGLSGVPVTLTSGQMVIDKDLTISGLGRELTLLMGPGLPARFDSTPHRFFEVLSNASLHLADLRLTNGISFGGPGAIINYGVLTMRDCDVDANWGEEGSGGAIGNFGGSVSLIRTRIYDNIGETAPGGGLYNDSTGHMDLSDCLILSNTAVSRFGGGIANLGGLTVERSSFSGNFASGSAFGGAIGNGGNCQLLDSDISANHASGGGGLANSGTLLIDGSTISRNYDAEFGGGGLRNQGHGTITNSTIVGNEQGGIFNSGSLTVTNVTVASNFVYGYHGFGGGIHNTGALTVMSSIIAGNYLLDFDSCQLHPGAMCGAETDCRGSFISGGGNLIGTLHRPDEQGIQTMECFGFTEGIQGDLIGFPVEQILETDSVSGGLDFPPIPNAVLADNTGPTPTVALIPGSPAIDAIPAANCLDAEGSPMATDQRGTPRPQGDGCDVGAFEFSIPWGVTFWAQQCRGKSGVVYDAGALQKLLVSVSDKYAASARCVPVDCDLLTHGQSGGSLQALAARELLAAWLNLASGKLTLGRPVSLDGLTDATTAGAALNDVSPVVCDPQARRDDLLAARSIARALNGGD